MFPVRYFNNHFFAGRYFPHYGLVEIVTAIVRTWTLSARSVAWSLLTRSTALTLGDRDLALSLESRDIDLSLDGRSTAWTLKDDDR